MFECLVIREWHYLGGIGRCGLVRESVSLGIGFEVTRAKARPNDSPSSCCL